MTTLRAGVSMASAPCCASWMKSPVALGRAEPRPGEMQPEQLHVFSTRVGADEDRADLGRRQAHGEHPGAVRFRPRRDRAGGRVGSVESQPEAAQLGPLRRGGEADLGQRAELLQRRIRQKLRSGLRGSRRQLAMRLPPAPDCWRQSCPAIRTMRRRPPSGRADTAGAAAPRNGWCIRWCRPSPGRS